MRLKPVDARTLLLRKLLPLFGSLLSLGAAAQTAPAASALPTGGQVSAGQASISQSGANLLIQQGSNRAAINWQSFNVGSNAQVQFQQPGPASVTLNRVTGSDLSQIFGRITSNGQVILTNPQGVYFSRNARVDVGGLIATTHGIGDADFMAGKNRFERKGSTGSVVNEGELKASLGGFIALLAPEVRNQGVIIARMGTVALAAGEAIDLHFDSNNRITSIRVEPSQIQALVDNRHAVQAPGGLIILSAQSIERLRGGVVRNSGRIEANGQQQQGGRIEISASHKVENTGSISANASEGTAAADAGPAGKIEINAPEVVNSGTISAVGSALNTAGVVLVQATNFSQTASGRIDLSAPQEGGTLNVQATATVQLQGQVDVSATQDTSSAASQGGQINIAAQGDILASDATLDASGAQGGQIQLRAAAPAQSDNPNPLPDVPNAPGQGRLAIMGNSTFSTRGRSSKGGLTTLLGDHIELLDATHMDATGATGGGTVLVGGDWQGSNGIYQATSVTMTRGVRIDASATDSGDGGKVVLWSDVHNAASVTQVEGRIEAKAAGTGSGGQVETSGHTLWVGDLSVNAQSAKGQDGLWLLDPYNITISAAADAITALASNQFTASATGGVVNATTLQNALASNAVTVSTAGAGSDAGNISVNADLAWSSAKVLTLLANGGVSGSGNIAMTGGTGAAVVFNQSGNSS